MRDNIEIMVSMKYWLQKLGLLSNPPERSQGNDRTRGETLFISTPPVTFSGEAKKADGPKLRSRLYCEMSNTLQVTMNQPVGLI